MICKYKGCSGLTSIDIPNSVTSIGHYAFEGCSGLSSVNIPNSVTYIGYDAFRGCSGLTSITVNPSNPNYDSRDNCNAIIETATNTLISGCMNSTIRNSVKSIGDWAFAGCSGLTSVTIPNSVTSIGGLAFDGCKSLTAIHSSILKIDDIIVGYAFIGFNFDNCTLYVPSGTRWAYRHHPVFGRFKNIEIESK